MIKKLKILVYGLVVMAFLQETCMPMPGFYEPAVEYTKETHESREELICLSVRKVTPLMRSHTSFYNLFLIPRKSVKHVFSLPFLDRTIRYRRFLI